MLSAKSAIDTLKNTFDHSVSNLTGAVYDIEYALIETQSMLGSLDNSFRIYKKHSMTIRQFLNQEMQIL